MPKKRLIILFVILCLFLPAFNACTGPKEENKPAGNETVKPVQPPEPLILYENPLSGEPEEKDYSKNRPYAVMLNNLPAALPQSSISNADMIFEMNVEGNLTRMMALFQSVDDVGNIGSVRSARPYYLNLVEAFDAVYIHAGGSEQAYSDMKSKGITHIDGVRSSGEIFWRDEYRMKNVGYEHSMFTSGEKINALVPDMKIRHEHKDGFTLPYKFTENVVAAQGQLLANETGRPTDFKVRMNKNKTTGFLYDPISRKYLVSEYDAPYIDGNTNEQFECKNVIVMYVNYKSIKGDKEGRLYADMTGGKGVYICEGRSMDINWKIEKNKGLLWSAADGSPLELATGNSYICCASSASGKIEDL
jgi:hypothetical protein